MTNRPPKQRVALRILSKIPFSILEKLAPNALILPYYHVVNDDEVLHVKHLYAYKKIKQFKEDLDFLLKNYSPIALHEALVYIKNGRPLPEKVFLLTFDDGFREMHDIVAPILMKKGVSATFFVNSAFIDNVELCYLNKASLLAEEFIKMGSSGLEEKLSGIFHANRVAFNDIRSGILSIKYQQRDILNEIAKVLNLDSGEYLLANKPYLTSDQIATLIKNGFTIGAHSIDHPLYSSLSLKDQLHQTIESVKLLRDRFSLNYGAFAFPHSDHNVTRSFFTELSNSGLVDVSFGTGGMISDCVPNNLQRFSMENPLMPAERAIATQLARRFAKLLVGKGKISRRI